MWVVRLTLATPENRAIVAAVESANTQKGGSSPILRPLAASVTASDPKDNQIAVPAMNAVTILGTDTRGTALSICRFTPFEAQ